MNTRHLHSVLPIILLLLASATLRAQTFSYDGNRWYEIEVSIFTNAVNAGNNEQVIPENVLLEYFEPNRQLAPAASSYMIPFAQTATTVADELLPEVAPVPQIGPANLPAGGSFKLADFSRDPFIALGASHARFTRYNTSLERSQEHRLLFHAVWRQPVLNRGQATAISVTGGDRFGTHNELEGSLRFSYNVNRVDVEARLWLSMFAGPGAANGQWLLPPQPAAGEDQAGAGVAEYAVEELAYMAQERAMISNDLHYLDHPAMGMLVEIRPYQLPEPTSLSFD